MPVYTSGMVKNALANMSFYTALTVLFTLYFYGAVFAFGRLW